MGFRGTPLLLGAGEQGTVGLPQLGALGNVPQEMQWLHPQASGLCVASRSQVSHQRHLIGAAYFTTKTLTETECGPCKCFPGLVEMRKNTW